MNVSGFVRRKRKDGKKYENDNRKNENNKKFSIKIRRQFIIFLRN